MLFSGSLVRDQPDDLIAGIKSERLHPVSIFALALNNLCLETGRGHSVVVELIAHGLHLIRSQVSIEDEISPS